MYTALSSTAFPDLALLMGVTVTTKLLAVAGIAAVFIIGMAWMLLMRNGGD